MGTIRLQGVGEKPAVPASTLKVGDVTIWNYGCKETITEILKETKASILFAIKCDSGYVGTRRLRKNRLVAKVC